MTATVKEQVESKTGDELISELTDKAIEAEIRKLDRMIKSREDEQTAIEVEMHVFKRRRALLIEQKIERLRAQLPQETQ